MDIICNKLKIFRHIIYSSIIIPISIFTSFPICFLPSSLTRPFFKNPILTVRSEFTQIFDSPVSQFMPELISALTTKAFESFKAFISEYTGSLTSPLKPVPYIQSRI